jgi:hypothetical protein
MSILWFFWNRQGRLLKGLTCLLVGFFLGSSSTYVILEFRKPKSPTTSYKSLKKKIHTSGFGGINNIAQPGGAKAYAEGHGWAHDPSLYSIPTSNIVHSLSAENILNHRGHYIHDEHRSPYASHLYGGKSKAYLEEQQRLFVEKMNAVRREWGAWTDIEQDDITRPLPNFSMARYGDINNTDFPENSWQCDEDYIAKFIIEAKALVNRVREGIYAEYGFPLKQENGTVLSFEEKEERDAKFEVKILNPNGTYPISDKLNTGIAWLSKPAMDGLVRKLLHALITNDEFYVVLGGHSAAAGHGNNFMQNQMMSMNYIMEPVFDKLGIRLISRNMGMGGVGTLQFSLAGKSLYGEADVMLWDSGMTERGGTVDIFNKQAVLSGERMPILLTSAQFNIMQETDGEAWIGEMRHTYDFLPLTIDEVQASQVPYAARYMHYTEPRFANVERYSAVCWEPRSDITPIQNQDEKFGSQVSWHPGFRHHQFEGRVLSLILLQGLHLALDQWEVGIQNDGFPLAEKYWHVGSAYERLRQKLRTYAYPSNSTEDPTSLCETVLPNVTRLCRVPMNGFGMWTPRMGNRNLLEIVKPAPNGYKPTYRDSMEYDSFDILPIAQRIPDGEVDVHAIAIATNNPPPNINHEYADDNETLNNSLDVPTRRWLKTVTNVASRKIRESMKNNLSPYPSESEPDSRLHRRLNSTSYNEDIIPGRGWEVTGWVLTDGFCDGSSMSACGRVPGGTCLASGHNDQHVGLAGNSLSGWLVFLIPKVKEGIVLARMEWWCGVNPEITANWNDVNDGKTNDNTRHLVNSQRQGPIPSSSEDAKRFLGKPTPDDLVPSDFAMDYAVNGVIKTMYREEWMSHITEHSKNCAVWPLVNDLEMAKRENWEGEELEVAIRFRSESNPRAGFCVSHIYYA